MRKVKLKSKLSDKACRMGVESGEEIVLERNDTEANFLLLSSEERT